MYLLDTNIVSQMRKIPKGKANPNVAKWIMSIDNSLFFINTIVLLEQQKWALSKRHQKDETQALLLDQWVIGLSSIFKGRIFPIDNAIGLKCAELHIPNPRPAFDSLIAATALVHNLTLVTNNEKDFKDIDNLRIVNPFS